MSSPSLKPRYLKLGQQHDGTWAFNDPPEWEFFRAKLDRALDAERAKDIETARQIYLNIIENCPDYLDAYNSLALLVADEGDVDVAIGLLEDAREIGENCFPEAFKDGDGTLPNYWEDNRPFLRVLRNLSLVYLRQAIDCVEYENQLRGLPKSLLRETLETHLANEITMLEGEQ